MKRFKITLSKKAFYSFVFLAMLLLAGLVYAAIDYGGRGTHNIQDIVTLPDCLEGQVLGFEGESFVCQNYPTPTEGFSCTGTNKYVSYDGSQFTCNDIAGW